MGWFFPHTPHSWGAEGFTFIEAVCRAAAVGGALKRRASGTLDDTWTVSLKTCDLSRLKISFSRNFNRYERSLSWPSPSLDHSSLTSWGKRDKIRGVRMTPYWVPQIPRASRERVCACKSSLSFHKFDTEHLFITGIFNSVCMWVKIIRSLRPNRSVSIWRADW